MKLDLIASASIWGRIERFLLANPSTESFVFGLARPIHIKRSGFLRFELIDAEAFEQGYEKRGAGGLSLEREASSFLNMISVKAAEIGSVPVHIHSHPAGVPFFSAYDDQNELSLHKWLAANGQPWLLSIVQAQDSLPHARLWRNGTSFPCGMRLGLRRIRLPESNKSLANSPTPLLAALDRQRAFGDGFRQAASMTTIGIAGLGGVGMPVAEILARSGFERFVLIDPDRIEEVNLNRLGHAGKTDIGRPKISLAKSIIKKAGTAIGSKPRVKTYACDINRPDEAAAAALAECDLLLALTDDDLSRISCLKIALENGVEYMQAGVGIFQEQDRITAIKVEFTGAEAGRYCPLCSGRLSAAQASIDARRLVGGDVLERAKAEGYIPEEPAPSVMSLNAVCAGALAMEIQKRMSGVGSDVDLWQHDFATGETLTQIGIEHCLHGSCAVCGRQEAA